MTGISSPQNPQIKQIRALRSRKERERTGRFYIEGIQLVAAALEHGAPVELVVVAPELLTSALGRQVARRLASAAPCLEVAGRVLASLTDREDLQGLGAVVRQRWTPLERLARGDLRCRVALDGVQYPGNLGAILRTSDATGGAGVILLGPTADPYDPAAVRASTGAIFTQELSRASPAQLGAWAAEHGATLVGASPHASVDYRLARYGAPAVLAMGSEGHGLSPAVLGLCRTLVHIPMVGSADSLNLAIATGLVLYEVFRQRQPLAQDAQAPA